MNKARRIAVVFILVAGSGSFMLASVSADLHGKTHHKQSDAVIAVAAPTQSHETNEMLPWDYYAL